MNALLDITLAINDNVSTEELVRRYEKLLTDDLNIGKVILLKYGEKWDCLLNSGFNRDFYKKIDIEKDLLVFTDISFITSEPDRFPELVDIVIPVTHKDKPIAYVLIGDIEEEGEGVSPIIKHVRFIQTLSNIITVAIENKRLFQESLRQEAIKREMELASKMQTMLIPAEEKLPSNESINMRAFYHPHFDVGGDYYDVIQLNEHEVGFCIADVSGKGISAAILMSNFQANLRALFSEKIEMKVLLEKLNERVMNSAKGEKFITLFIARYNYQSRELCYVNAGHNPPLFYEISSKKMSQLGSGCVGMGMLDTLPFVNVQKLILDKPSKLFCYTDGLVEVLHGSGIEFGTQGLEAELTNAENIETNIHTIIKKQKILEGSKAIFDDISILGIEFPGKNGFE
ncbi:MAG: SpoIIE family protein phosphatase [Bacteroidales bacterium]|nr:SpoIIE family protein phosphatase [Bacteroidales bacterium]MBN2698376.1 SpoIIE family protein phosphatase [Bacteroidales bacterium]